MSEDKNDRGNNISATTDTQLSGEGIDSRFFDILEKGKTQFHVNELCKDKLIKAGYKEKEYYSDWNLEKGGKYFTSPFTSVLFAFTVGEEVNSMRLTACHTDFPMLKVKSKPELNKKGYLEANVEPYGGLIKETWFDRPLGMAGKVIVEGKNVFAPEVRLLDSQNPVCIIPSLAPHLRKGGKAEEIDVQKELLPLFDMQKSGEDKNWLVNYIAAKLSVKAADILDYDLYLYNCDLPNMVGISKELISSPRIDNLSSVSALLEVLCEKDNKENQTYYNRPVPEFNNCIAIAAFFDNEEIGSRSKQGADSMLYRDIVEKILDGVKNIDKNEVRKNSFCISLDVAHATHPNYQEKSDITNDIVLGKGVVLKSSASQRYVTDSEAGAVIEAISRKNNVKLQRQVNRSGMPGGQTLGPIMSSYLPMRAVDMGIPMLAMHSACELAHIDDYKELVKLLRAYYEM